MFAEDADGFVVGAGDVKLVREAGKADLLAHRESLFQTRISQQLSICRVLALSSAALVREADRIIRFHRTLD